MSQVTFAELGLPNELVESLANRRITEPFEIQTKAVPDAVLGRDILGRAPTGSGKTLAFGLPLLARLEKGGKKRPRGLILSPTRELAEQICRELEPLAKAMDRNVLAVYGGTGMQKQINALRKGVDLVVACPGRLLDLIEQKACRLDGVDIVVVDEADRMADMGFLPDVRKLLDQTSEDRQTVLFSATLDNDVQVLIDKYQHDPVVHEVGEIEPDLTLVDHRFIKVPKTDRIWLAADVIADAGPTVIFVRTRHGVDRLARQLKQEGIKAGYIHGGRSQSQRDRALQVFTDRKVDALVATDVAARGIHVDGVACVIHYDPPADMKDYVHRSGRTARAGADGVVVSFLDPPQVKESKKMQRKLGLESEIEPLPERMPRSSRPAPIDERELNGKGGSRKPKAKRDRPDRKRSDFKDRKPKSRSKDRSEETSEDRKPRTKTQYKKRDRSEDNYERSERSERGERSSRPSRSNRSDRTERSERSDRSERSARSDRSARGERSDRTERPERGERSDRRNNGSKAGGAKGRYQKNGSPRSSGAKASTSSGSSTRTPREEEGFGTDGSPARSAKPTSGRGPGKAKAKSGTKAKAGPKGSVKPKSKRSGKPRPKNRKNKPKSTKVS